MEKKSCDKCVRWLCGILFSAFAFCWFYIFQRDLVSAEIRLIFAGSDSLVGKFSDSHLIVSLILTVVSLLLAIPGRILLRFKKGLYGCNYLLSALFLGIFTGYDGDSFFGQSYTVWMATVISAVSLFLICKIIASVPKSEYNDRPRTLAGNLLLMSILFTMVGYIGNTDENLHRRLGMERMYSEKRYAELLEIGRDEEESDASIDLLRAKAMLNLPVEPNPAGSGIGEMLFRYSIYAPKALANSLKSMDNTQAYLSACLLNCNIESFRDSIHLENYKTLPTYYMQALVIANDSLANVVFTKQFKEEKELYDSFLRELSPLEGEPVQFRINSTYINFHETYFWFYTFKK